MSGTIVVRFAKYASYYGLIFMDKRHTMNPRKFTYLRNFYVYGIALSLPVYCKS